MRRKFNVTGVCVKNKHYMVDISNKLQQIEQLIEHEEYFVINRPRQYGKTTTLNQIYNCLKEKYLVLDISFEGLGDTAFENEANFINALFGLFKRILGIQGETELVSYVDSASSKTFTLDNLSDFITELVKKSDKEIIMLIDEVDKSSNNQLFLHFLGMLRNKYLYRNKGQDYTFKSVILAGVHDVKTLKLKLRPDEEKKYNSPWNIATDFEVDISFNQQEIASMLQDYLTENDIKIDIPLISEKLRYYTSGYPFLVSRLCKLIDEKLDKDWSLENLENAIKMLLVESNTNFEDLIKNLENNDKLRELTRDIILYGLDMIYNIDVPEINLGITYGVFANQKGRLKIHNKIYEQRIYNYMSAKYEQLSKLSNYNFKDKFINEDGSLNVEKILIKFQQFMKENYSFKDVDFIEREGRLIFLAFIKPIINGVGFDFKEVQVSEEKRMDIVITYNQFKYVIELKIWYGEEKHKKGLLQLSDYLDIYGLTRGYLLIFNFNKDKEYYNNELKVNNKDIFEVVV